MQVIGSIFSGAGKDGDFAWMITKDNKAVIHRSSSLLKAENRLTNALIGARLGNRPCQEIHQLLRAIGGESLADS